MIPISEIKIESNLPAWVLLLVFLFYQLLLFVAAILAGVGGATYLMLHTKPQIEKYHEPTNGVDTIKNKKRK